MTMEVSAFLLNKSVSTWFKEALTSALARDPVDAANDAATLAELLQKQADATLAESAKALGLKHSNEDGNVGYPRGG